MSTWAIVPVKGFQHAKSRLAPSLEPRASATEWAHATALTLLESSGPDPAKAARYHATATLMGTQKSHTFELHPRVESDATRVEW